ncbi:hypothetical protein [Bdellovibrio sp. HCB-162]|uniref:hypothetical protein n=1 Tax=Bdellovibrio sp. HCB-162 TaxID=3394234 RepID=UPI0039BC8723
MNYKKQLLPLLACTALIACQKDNSGHKPLTPSPITPKPVAETEYKTPKTIVDEKTGLTVTTQEVTDEALARLKQEAQLTTLTPFPVDPRYNAQLFTLDQKEYRDFVFIAPKVYAFSTADGARVSILENEDGTVSIPFHVTMVSGLENKIPGPKGQDLINVPESYLIKKTDDLRTEISSRSRNKVALLPGCPKAFSIKVVDREFDVTPKDLSISDYCDLTKPFTVALRTSKSMAQYILQNALYNNTVDLRADYQTMVPYLASKVTVTFDKRRIYDELEIHFKANYKGIASVDARYYTEKIMRNQTMSVDIRGNYDQQLQFAVDQAMKLFFVEVPDVKKVELECSGAMACVTFNRDYRDFQQNLSFSFERTENTLGSRVFRSTTRLQPLNDRSVVIGEASAEVTDQGFNRPSLFNNDSSIETGLTIQPGDLLEISPSYLNIEERELEKPKTTKTSNNVCVESSTKSVCHSVPATCINRSAGPEVAACRRENVCEEVRTCGRYEDQFVISTEYSSSLSRMKKVERPVGQFKEIYEGLTLKFTVATYDRNETKFTEVVCPLRYFQREGNGDSLTVRIENQPGCEIFKKNQNLPILHIKNDIQIPKKFKVGVDKVNWKGEVLHRHSEDTFSPAIGFGGTIRIRGYRIDSQHLN